MISRTTEGFRKAFKQLPQEIQKQTKSTYSKFQQDPYHPSLHFKRVHSMRPIYSVRVSRDYRSVGLLNDNEIIWYWIGSHADYDKLLKNLRNT